ncbi:MAG TPA: LysR family transcriptional regulator [Rhizomicrobium sp.]|jgi:DNA-binding transcriptional LysR family regulator
MLGGATIRDDAMFNTTLRAFDETARRGSIRKASDALGVAPSSVSRNVALLEREMGTALFERHAGGVVLTHAGQLVADYARSVLLDYDSLRSDLDDRRGTQRRLLRLALVESVASSGPVSAVAKFSEKFRSVSFHLRIMPAPMVVETVQQGQCDIGVAFCAQPNPEIVMLAQVSEPIMLAVPLQHALAHQTAVRLRDIAGLRLALPDLDFGVRRIFDQACAQNDIRSMPVLSSNTFETLRDFVRCGAGAAILPMRAIARYQRTGELRGIPIAETPFQDTSIDIIALKRRRLPRIVRVFAESLVAEIKATA